VGQSKNVRFSVQANGTAVRFSLVEREPLGYTDSTTCLYSKWRCTHHKLARELLPYNAAVAFCTYNVLFETMTMTLMLVDIITTHTEKTYKTYQVIVIYDRNENIIIWNT